MFELKDFSKWKPYEGFSEGSGRSEKIWLISGNDDNREIGLFKYPKVAPDTGNITTEHISEHLAHQIGNILNIKTAKVDIGTYNGRIGSISYIVNNPKEAIVEGISFVSGVFPAYNPETMYDADNNKYYCLEHIFNSTEKFSHKETWIKMMLFDYIIGNRDRHQSNWAILAAFTDETKNKIYLRECPLYDNGSSLCCYVNDSQIDKYFGKDYGPIAALIDTQSRSLIRIDGNAKKTPKHSDMVRYLLKTYAETYDLAKAYVDKLSYEMINDLLSQYPVHILSEKKNLLIQKYLVEKMKLLDSILEEKV